MTVLGLVMSLKIFNFMLKLLELVLDLSYISDEFLSFLSTHCDLSEELCEL